MCWGAEAVQVGMGRLVGLSCSERKGLPSREMEGCGGLWEWSSVGQAPSPICET